MNDAKVLWQDMVKSTVDKLEMGSRFGLDVRFDADAAGALAELIKLMAGTIDDIKAHLGDQLEQISPRRDH